MPIAQADRRAGTQAALLDATVRCLAEHGYARTTTGRVAELAGVSRGAQLRYFRSRADLVTAAVRHLAQRRAATFTERLGDGPTTVEACIDALWEGHQAPLFDAALELWVAARTDAELRRHLVTVEREVAATIFGAAEVALGELSHRDGFTEDLLNVLAAMRGLALLQVSNGANSRLLANQWLHLRADLVMLLGRQSKTIVR